MPRGVNRDGSVNRGQFRRGVSRPQSAAHRKAIGDAQRVAWGTKRKRLPLGSKNTDRHGYVRVKVMQGKGRWELEHILVMERIIGRTLRPEEVVHHINGDRQDNSEGNLYLCRDRKHHNDIERQLKETFRALLKREVVTFSHSLGIYACH